MTFSEGNRLAELACRLVQGWMAETSPDRVPAALDTLSPGDLYSNRYASRFLPASDSKELKLCCLAPPGWAKCRPFKDGSVPSTGSVRSASRACKA